MKIVSVAFLAFLLCSCSLWKVEKIIHVWDEMTNEVVPIETLSSVSRTEWMNFFDRIESRQLRTQVIDFVFLSNFISKREPLFIFEKHSQGRSFYTVYLCQENRDSCIYSYSSDRETIFDNVKVVSADPFHQEMDRIKGTSDKVNTLVAIDSLAASFTIVSKLTPRSVHVKEVIFY
jgi:hypothetical protein